MNKENFSLTYFVSRMLFSGSIYSIMFNYSENDALIACIFGTIFGLFIIFLINKMNLNNPFFKIILFLLYLYFIIISFVTFETYTDSFLLTNTPKIITVIPALAIGIYASFKSINTLKRVSFIFFILSISSFTLIIIMLSSYLNIGNVLPLFSHSKINILQSAFTFGVLSSTPNILLKEENISLKKHMLYYFLTSILNLIICYYILSVLTPNVAKIYSFPEYMVLKRIKIFDFIENVENLSVLVYYFDYFFLITLSFKRIYNLIKNKTAYLLIITSTVLLTTITFVKDYSFILFLYHYSTYILFVFLLILSLSIFKSNEKYK